MFEWNNTYMVGIPSIDAQHKTLFQIAGQLHQAMTTGKGSSVIGTSLDRLLDYTKAHFADEERLLRQNKYPDFAAHRAKHVVFTTQIADFATKFRAGQGAITIEVLQFLRNWLVDHIKGTDRKYVPYLDGKAVA